jgi:hypothetical protein
MSLADMCGYITGDVIDVVDKAILLIKWNVDISCKDAGGNTPLHRVLMSERLHERLAKQERLYEGTRCFLSRREPGELLIVFITAGVDIYTKNEAGQTPSTIAHLLGREKEWAGTFEFCGYDSKEVMQRSCLYCSMEAASFKYWKEFLLHTYHRSWRSRCCFKCYLKILERRRSRFTEVESEIRSRPRRASKLTFEEYCKLREPKDYRLEELLDEDFPDNYEEFANDEQNCSDEECYSIDEYAGDDDGEDEDSGDEDNSYEEDYVNDENEEYENTEYEDLERSLNVPESMDIIHVDVSGDDIYGLSPNYYANQPEQMWLGNPTEIENNSYLTEIADQNTFESMDFDCSNAGDNNSDVFDWNNFQ